jgi:putative nucleotidyltransferase-like protein
VGTNRPFDAMGETLKKATAALRDAEVPFVVGGSLAGWARGGPEPQHDLDIMVKPEDAEAALQVLVNAGMRSERPPEGWLYKAWDGDVLLDVIFNPKGLAMDDEVLARAEDIDVLAVRMPVMSIEDMLTTKLLALDEHSLDYTSLIQIARALRELIDWPALRRRTAGSPYAKPFFALAEELDIAPSHPPSTAHSHVRVLGPQPAATPGR